MQSLGRQAGPRVDQRQRGQNADHRDQAGDEADAVDALLARVREFLERRCKEQMDIELKVRDTVKEYLVENSFDSKYGARPLKRAIQSKIEDPLAEAILNGEVKKGDTVAAGMNKKEITFKVLEKK